MPGANVHTLESLKEAKAALAKFAEDAGALLANVDSDVARMGQWITHERPAHWKQQVRKREEMVQAARQEISRKQLAAAPNPASTVLERKVLARAIEKLEEGRRRQQNTRRWAGVWEKESLMARGSISQLAEFIRADIPRAIARIDRMMVQLEEYLSLRAPSAESVESIGTEGDAAGGPRDADASMARSEAASERGVAQAFEHLRALWAEAVGWAKEAREPVAWGALAVDVLTERQREEIGRLAVAGKALTAEGVGEATIVVAANALDRPLVWLMRGEEAAGGAGAGADSGWYMGPLDNPQATGACWRVPLRELLESRPDLGELLGAEAGTLAVLGPGGPLAVVDRGGRNVWAAEG